jgi:hypothetical protein
MSEIAQQGPARRESLDLGTIAKFLLIVVILAASALLLSGTVATTTTSTVNRGGGFVAGSLILSNSVEGRSPCLSSGGRVSCDNLFNGIETPGQAASSRVTLENVGTIPPDGFFLYSTFCRSVDGPGTGHGGGDLCQVAMLTIHDDVHDACYYPTAAPGPCTAQPSATLADFLGRYPANNPLKLSTDHLGSGETFTVTALIDSGAGNQYQGRIANMDLNWHLSQG